MTVDVQKWLGKAPVSVGTWRPGRPSDPSSGNQVKYFIHVGDYYQDVGAEIRKTRTNIADFVYLTGWILDLNTFVDPPGANRQRLVDVLTDAAKRKVQIRLLLDDLPNGTENANALQTLGSLPGFEGLIDKIHSLVGAQHEKLAIIRNSGGVFAYCGSADFENQRLGRLGNPGPKQSNGVYASSPFHEVNVRWEGPVVRDIWNGFCLRYAAASSKRATTLGGLPGIQNNPGYQAIAEKILPASLQPPGPTMAGTDGVAGLYWPTGHYQDGGVAARVVRTLPNGRRQRPTNFNFGRDTAYDYVPAGEHTYYDLVTSAIRNTTRYLYVEDQYLFFSANTVLGRSIAEHISDLVAKPSFEKMIAVIAAPGTIQGESYQAGTRRRDFLQALGQGQDKVEVYIYNGNLGSPYWIHAKMWIFDDELAVVGSANINRRGYTSDVETGVAFCSTDIADDANVVKRLRVDLWEKHLNARPLDEDQNPIPGNRLVPDKKVLDEFVGASGLWRKAPLLTRVDADLKAHPLPDIDAVQAKTDSIANRYFKTAVRGLGNVLLRGRDAQWDYAVDPDGA